MQEKIRRLTVEVLVHQNGYDREEAEQVAIDCQGSELWEAFEEVLEQESSNSLKKAKAEIKKLKDGLEEIHNGLEEESGREYLQDRINEIVEGY